MQHFVDVFEKTKNDLIHLHQSVTQLRLCGLSRLRPEQRRGGVARRKLDKEKNHDRHAEDHWKNPDEPSCDEGGHRAERLLN